MLYIKPQPHHLKQTRLCLLETVPITSLIYYLISLLIPHLDHLALKWSLSADECLMLPCETCGWFGI